ncbi:NAD(P)H-binding protein [Jatrophihabitans endophyticus]|uniref:NAD(P)H-binding protein n=1 Tax=Jatrophihabitans endophyticus TaxID=1206085 RepID=UPI0009346A38|nr:NAD(P)H-binding protein [Jatrophihabitans endophyticus]
MPVLDRFFGASYADMARMETVLVHSPAPVQWVSLRPPRLLDRPGRNSYRIQVDQPLPRARSITYADLATALLDARDRPDLFRHVAYVAN